MEVTINDSRQFVETSGPTAGKIARLIIYTDAAGNQATVIVKSEHPTEDMVKSAIRADIAHRAPLVGKKLSL
jgi:hypothetical protein